MIEFVLALILGAIAVGEVPVFQLNRATLALIGAVVVVLLGVIPLEQAYQAIDWNTLALLFAMMVFTAHLRLAGFFEIAGRSLAHFAGSPRTLLVVVLIAGAVLSALFINDTVVLVLTPLVTQLTLSAGLNPLPFLIGLAVSSNIGSMTTPIGNPQNILIATSSGLGFGDFVAPLAVPALLALIFAWCLIAGVYRKDLRRRPGLSPKTSPLRVHHALLGKCGFGIVVMIAGFALGWSLALSSLAGASILLLTRRVKPQKVLGRIDGTLILFFAALFVITKAIESTAGFRWLLDQVRPMLSDNVIAFSAVSALLSNLISNVPAVMVIKPLVPTLAHPDQSWIALAAASTLAGNLTLMGSVANLIVAESARTYGVRLGFGEYLKVGLPLGLVSIAVTAFWLQA